MVLSYRIFNISCVISREDFLPVKVIKNIIFITFNIVVFSAVRT